MVKTVSHQEQKQMIKMLKDWTQHMASNPDSLINKIYGCHGIQMNPQEKVKYFLVMESVLWTGNPMYYRFDLKGSTVDRTVYKKAKGRALLHMEDEAGHMQELGKDSDLKELKFTVRVTKAQKARLMDQIKKDTHLFAAQNIMDYSLLLTKHTRRDGEESKHTEEFASNGYIPYHRQDEGGMAECREAGAEGTQLYYIGIIDILQLFDYKKVGENFLKGRCLCKGIHGISSVPSEEYRTRYIAAMDDLVQAVDETGTFDVEGSASEVHVDLEDDMVPDAELEMITPVDGDDQNQAGIAAADDKMNQ